jgi:hypothetical protein
LTRLGAGQAAVDSYVEAFTAQGTAQFAELGRELFLAMATDPAKKAQLEPLIEQARAILGIA